MSFLDHLGELRSLIIHALIAVLILSVGLWFVSGRLLDLLIKDLPVQSLYFNSPIEAFMVRMKVSFVLGTMGAFPYILFRGWSFVSPGLFKHERHRVYPLVITGSTLFYLGVVFCYLILIPVVLKFLLSFGTERLNPLLSVSSYFGFVAKLSFTFGLVFQIPVVVLLLSSLGLVTPRMLLRQWRYAITIIFVASAILTPPDALSMLLMALPVVLLYISSILVAMVVVRRKKRKSAGE
jgi:sec-independent protein translocase protein TatC